MTNLSLTVQIFSLIGALLCLLAYMGHQLHWLDARKSPYNLLNIAGSGILGYIALEPFQAGFFVMEVTWMAISLFGLFKALKNLQDPTPYEK